MLTNLVGWRTYKNQSFIAVFLPNVCILFIPWSKGIDEAPPEECAGLRVYKGCVHVASSLDCLLVFCEVGCPSICVPIIAVPLCACCFGHPQFLRGDKLICQLCKLLCVADKYFKVSIFILLIAVIHMVGRDIYVWAHQSR